MALQLLQRRACPLAARAASARADSSFAASCAAIDGGLPEAANAAQHFAHGRYGECLVAQRRVAEIFAPMPEPAYGIVSRRRLAAVLAKLGDREGEAAERGAVCELAAEGAGSAAAAAHEAALSALRRGDGDGAELSGAELARGGGAAEALVHVGLASASGGDAPSAQEAWAEAAALSGADPLGAAVAELHLGRALTAAGDFPTAEEALTRALSGSKLVFGDESLELLPALHALALNYDGRGDGIMAEGLFQGALGRLHALDEAAGGATPATLGWRLRVMEGLADLLGRIKWNNESRERDAQPIRAELAALSKSTAHAPTEMDFLFAARVDTWELPASWEE